MPNFLGSSDHFSKEFARPISKGQKLDAAAVDVATRGMEEAVLCFCLVCAPWWWWHG
jgi:hypothetical protein